MSPFRFPDWYVQYLILIEYPYTLITGIWVNNIQKYGEMVITLTVSAAVLAP